MRASQFDKKFDAGKDITASLDLTKARRPGLEAKRVTVDFPKRDKRNKLLSKNFSQARGADI